MRLPPDVRQLVARKFVSSRRAWLACPGPEAPWPLVVPLGIPAEPASVADSASVRAWANAWREWRGPGRLVWIERRWRTLGTQSLPDKLILDDADQAAAWANESHRWRCAAERYAALSARWPALRDAMASYFDILADYSDSDFGRLLDVLAWLVANPASGLYVRQLPVPGLDTKWLDSRRGLVAELLALLAGGTEGDADFYASCGLRRPPLLVRMRILDPRLRALVSGLDDVIAPLEQIAAMRLPATAVLVIENVQSGLALGDMPGTVAFIGLGYSVDLLGRIPWIRDIPSIYWGDIDTHGFAILNRARLYLPRIRSVLMDEATLTRHIAFRTEEKTPSTVAGLDLLTHEERVVWQGLVSNAWGGNLRLEQEKIAWPDVQAALNAALNYPASVDIDASRSV